MTTIKTKLNRYSFDVSTVEGKAAYEKLCTKLTAQGLTCFKSHGGGSHFIRFPDNSMSKTVQLETAHLFINQWNTAPIKGMTDKGLRVFDWAQDYPSNLSGCAKNIKRGHYLQQTEEMREIRRNTCACGYCGKQEPAQKGYIFCPHCIDSEYLERKQLHLLRMLPVESKADRAELTKAEEAHLFPLYTAAQSGATSARAKARHDKKRSDLEKEYKKAIKTAETEYKGFNWLMDNGLNIDNCIYYSHTDRFSFGWLQTVDAEVVNAILEVIREFPFDYEIKCADGRTLSN